MSARPLPNGKPRAVARSRVAAALAAVLCSQAEETAPRLILLDETEEVVAAVAATVALGRARQRQGK